MKAARVGKDIEVEALAQAFVIAKFFYPSVKPLALWKDLLETSEEGKAMEVDGRMAEWYPVATEFVGLLDFGASATRESGSQVFF